MSESNGLVPSNGNGDRAATLARLVDESRYAPFLGTDTQLKRTFTDFYFDPNIADCRGELALQRSLLASYLLRIGEESQKDITKLPGELVAGVTALNNSIARLALTVDAVQSKAPTSVTVSQIAHVVELLVNAVADTLNDVLSDGVMANDEVRRGVMENLASRMEELILPTKARRREEAKA